MEQPLCPPRAGSGDPEGKLDWGGRGDGWTSRGFEVAGVVWVQEGVPLLGPPRKGCSFKALSGPVVGDRAAHFE